MENRATDGFPVLCILIAQKGNMLNFKFFLPSTHYRWKVLPSGETVDR